MPSEIEHRLDSWKEIALFLGRDVRTVQRWEKLERLPVHRHLHAKVSSVYAFKSELLEWQMSRRTVQSTSTSSASASAPPEIDSYFPQTTALSTQPTPLPNQLKPLTSARSRNTKNFFAASIFVIAGLAALFFFRHPASNEWNDNDIAPVPLTSYLGEQYSPTFSSDGRQVAFVWNGPFRDNFNIYVKPVDSQSFRRLTTSADLDFSPAWSPDGKWVAFCRGRQSRGGAIWLISPNGGPERKLLDLDTFAVPSARSLTWSPDSKWLATAEQLHSAHPLPSGIHVIQVGTGEIKQVTFPGPGQNDVDPSFSFRGRQLAFTRDVGRGVSANYITALDSHMSASSPTLLPVETTGFANLSCSLPVWTPDNREIIFTSNRGGLNRLWSVTLHRPDKARMLAALGNYVSNPAISAHGQIAYEHVTLRINIWRLDVKALSEGRSAAPAQVTASTRLEDSPQISPDGKTLAFVSDRTGFTEIWTSTAAGSDPKPLTSLRSPGTGSPSWSPDGKQIAFDSRVEGTPEIYVVPADGSGRSVRLTHDSFGKVIPRWSPDGRFIFFASEISGTLEIWKMTADGKQVTRVTKKGGFSAACSPDGKRLYYNKQQGAVSPLWELDFSTGEEKPVLPAILNRAFAPAREGIYYFNGKSTGPENLLYYDNRSGKSRCLLKLDHPLRFGPALSPDGHFLYYSQVEQNTSNLLLVDIFR